MAMTCGRGITTGSFLRGDDHGIVRFEVLGNVRVLEITGEAPDLLAKVVTVENDIPAIIFTMNVIGHMRL
jgi:hypothetical protein